jgi:hypothetical protein
LRHPLEGRFKNAPPQECPAPLTPVSGDTGRVHMSRMEKIAKRALAAGLTDLLRDWLIRAHTVPVRAFFVHSSFAWIEVGNEHMARKSNPKHGTFSRNGGTGSSDVEWANFKFTDEEIALVIETASDVPGLMLEVAKLVIDGCDLTVKRNPDRENYSAFVIIPSGGDSGKRRGISAFATSGIDALAAVCLKYHIGKSSPDRFTFASNGLGIG